MLSAFDPDGERDLVFIPVGINYDRVLEDRMLVHELDPESDPYTRTHVVTTLLRFVVHQAGADAEAALVSLRLCVREFRTTDVDAGVRAQARDRLQGHGIRPHASTPWKATGRRAPRGRRGSAIPVVPVPLVATVFTRRPGHAMSELEIKAQVHSLIEELQLRGAYVHIPRGDRDYEVAVGLRMLTLRHFVEESARDLPRERARTGHAAVLRQLHRALPAGSVLSRP